MCAENSWHFYQHFLEHLDGFKAGTKTYFISFFATLGLKTLSKNPASGDTLRLICIKLLVLNLDLEPEQI